MERDEPNIKIDFIRHGSYDSSRQDVLESEYPLTDIGRKEVREIKERVAVEKGQTVSFSGNNLRSLTSVVSAANLADPNFVGILDVNNAIDQKRLVQDPELLYRFLGNFLKFKTDLGIPKEQKKLFRAVIQYSDKYKKETGSEMTTYKDMREKVAKIILKYVIALQSWEKVSPKYKNPTMFRLVCANEYFYACFRFRITELVLGQEEAEKYMNWYEKEYERNENLKLTEQSFSVIRKDNLVEVILKDVYGELRFTDDKLFQV